MTRMRAVCTLSLLLLSCLPVLGSAGSEQPGSSDLFARIVALQEAARQVAASCGGDERMAEIVAQLSALYAELPQDRHGTLDQGGEACADAAPIDSLPFCDFGWTSEHVDDYTPPTACGTSSAPDVVYAYTSPIDQSVGVSLCGSGFNTILYVWEWCPGPAPAQLVCCNDDAPVCAPQSCCPSVFMRAGVTYYIIVDGAGTDHGQYVLHVGPSQQCPSEPCPPCSVACPPGALAEGEGCPPAFPDYYNAGCFWSPFNATALGCGQTVCGSSYYNGYVDHDAYIVTITQRDSLIWCMNAEFDFRMDMHQFFTAG